MAEQPDDQQVLDTVGKYLHRFISEGKRSNFPILSKINEEKAIRIWIQACLFIDKHLENNKAVQIQQLGTFTFSSKRLDIGNNKIIIVQRPVFLLSERLAQTHGLTYTKHHVSGEIPVVTMNFTAIAILMNEERDLVEGCIREILQALSRVIAYREPVQFMFYNIGYLLVRDFRARAKFTPSFIKKMDGTGHLTNLIESKKNKSGAKRSAGKGQKRQKSADSFKSETDKQKQICDNRVDLPVIENDHVHATSSVPLAGLVSTDPRDLLPKQSSQEPATTSKKCPLEFKERPVLTDEKTNFTESNRVNSGRSEAINSGTSGTGSRRSNMQTSSLPLLDEDDICYAAFQRKMLLEEKRRREAQADAVLQRYQDHKDKIALEDERLELDLARARAKDVADANLLTALKSSESELAKLRRDSKYSARAYIFKDRPLTPARFQKQQQYSNALAEQVDIKHQKKIAHLNNKDKNEREEQINLSNEIQEINHTYHADVRANQKAYRRALTSQIKVKELIQKESSKQEELVEPSIPTGTYFGRHHDDTPHWKAQKGKGTLAEERARAKAIFKAQVAMVNEKKRKAIKDYLSRQESECQVLRRTKTELHQEQKFNYENFVSRRKSLEANWINHAMEKRAKEKEHTKFTKTELLLNEKEAALYEKYPMLFKAKPTGYHSGRFKSNIWRESRYIPGSRLMV